MLTFDLDAGAAVSAADVIRHLTALPPTPSRAAVVTRVNVFLRDDGA